MKIRHERENITNDFTEIKRIKIKKKCLKQLYANKLDNTDEIDKFLEKHKL